MPTTHDCTCQLEHAMSNLARYARDAESARAREHAEGKLNEHEEAEVGKTHEEREKMPAGAFLEPASRKYPVKEHRNGEWVYTRQLLLAAARRARLEGDHSLAAKADAIRNREFGEEDHQVHDLMPNIMAARARTGDADAQEVSRLEKVINLLERDIKTASTQREKGALMTDLAKAKRDLAKAKSSDHALDCMPNLKAIRDARSVKDVSPVEISSRYKALRNMPRPQLEKLVAGRLDPLHLKSESLSTLINHVLNQEFSRKDLDAWK